MYLPSAKLSLAPMLDLTDRHFRYLCRLMAKNILLYTELTTTGALLYGKNDFLAYNEEEHPIAMQLGGCDPQALAKCAKMVADRAYDEINLNVGCPSDRVQNGSFGAILMRNRPLVCDCIKAMKDAVAIPVTVKTRLGVDELNSYDYIHDFIQMLVETGCDAIILHARMAFLQGMSPKENRDKPPLDYQRVYQLKQDFPQVPIIINGNIITLTEAKQHLNYVDGVMMGRALYHNPYQLIDADELIYHQPRTNIKPTREDIIRAMYPYIEQHLAQGGLLKHISRHFLGMFTDCPNARAFRKYIATHHYKEHAGIEVLEEALAQLTPSILTTAS